MDVAGGEPAKLLGRNRDVGRQEAAVGGDDLHAEHARRPGEAPGVFELSAEVETAQECERLVETDRSPLPESLGQGKPPAAAQEQLGTLAATVCGRQQEDS